VQAGRISYRSDTLPKNLLVAELVNSTEPTVSLPSPKEPDTASCPKADEFILNHTAFLRAILILSSQLLRQLLP
jgi:hypothetical protein